MKKILFFDTETTGLPKNWSSPMSDLDNWPRVIQLAASSYREDGEKIDSFELLIKPNGWEVPNEKFWIDNGFSNNTSIKHGIPIKEALSIFSDHHDTCDFLVAHNMSYDYNVLGAEMIRSNISCVKRLNKICTKEIGAEFCKIPNKFNNGFKWPSLSELHKALFNEDIEDSHKALIDVESTAKCFFKLVEIGLIKTQLNT